MEHKQLFCFYDEKSLESDLDCCLSSVSGESVQDVIVQQFFCKRPIVISPNNLIIEVI